MVATDSSSDHGGSGGGGNALLKNIFTFRSNSNSSSSSSNNKHSKQQLQDGTDLPSPASMLTSTSCGAAADDNNNNNQSSNNKSLQVPQLSSLGENAFASSRKLLRRGGSGNKNDSFRGNSKGRGTTTTTPRAPSKLSIPSYYYHDPKETWKKQQASARIDRVASASLSTSTSSSSTPASTRQLSIPTYYYQPPKGPTTAVVKKQDSDSSLDTVSSFDSAKSNSTNLTSATANSNASSTSGSVRVTKVIEEDCGGSTVRVTNVVEEDFGDEFREPEGVEVVAVEVVSLNKSTTITAADNKYKVQQQQSLVNTALTTTASQQLHHPLKRRTVTFSTVQVRRHKITVGDNPNCELPLSLDWSHACVDQIIPIDKFRRQMSNSSDDVDDDRMNDFENDYSSSISFWAYNNSKSEAATTTTTTEDNDKASASSSARRYPEPLSVAERKALLRKAGYTKEQIQRFERQRCVQLAFEWSYRPNRDEACVCTCPRAESYIRNYVV